ncbi:hypothetical protein DPMN_166292 [Dreissena polymorpha]|uniref:Uncharacterized protein n=1 Tax=Dreissena polymorpha TaxID=45954 RepID=A0A9D4F1Z1_DREPO|nr:hypothetical protein DPMN_166292 [Dreissena polymorpha]
MITMAPLVLLFLVVVVVPGANAQPWFMGGGLDDMLANIHGMAAGLHMQGAAMMSQGMRHAQFARQYGPGGREFRTPGGRGYAYNSPDGSFSSYSFSSGSPGSGYMFHSGPGGSWERRW